MINPFEVLDNRLSNIESLLLQLRENQQPPKPESDDNRFITRNEAARLLGVNLVTLDKICKQGALQKHRNGSIVRLKKSEVLEVFKTFEKRKRYQFV